MGFSESSFRIRFCIPKGTNRIFHNVIYNIRRRVINAARLLDLRLILDDCPVSFGQADNLAQKLLIHLAENVGRQHGKFIRAVRIVEALDDVFQRFVIY